MPVTSKLDMSNDVVHALAGVVPQRLTCWFANSVCSFLLLTEQHDQQLLNQTLSARNRLLACMRAKMRLSLGICRD